MKGHVCLAMASGRIRWKKDGRTGEDRRASEDGKLLALRSQLCAFDQPAPGRQLPRDNRRPRRDAGATGRRRPGRQDPRSQEPTAPVETLRGGGQTDRRTARRRFTSCPLSGQTALLAEEECGPTGDKQKRAGSTD
ncbi:hypothetical protein EYF80_048548 [Liparis tanakae]|uniref:Uncharacterized protein n=1 Tax=Liparis tanakae TaxID=230148 RepID=A0A4Z2FKM4_9TELE|nr:hypothetical protein EYF80_048548 [Liparis tanakae]